MRKAFECVLCEGVYADAPVSECDCASKANVFSEGVILSAVEWESLRKDAERYRWLRGDCYHAHVQVTQEDGSQPYVYAEELDRSVDFAIAALGQGERP